MNKVLVTGLSLGKDLDTCGVCNFEYEWLLRYPSILLWADKILISKATWDIIGSAAYPDPKPLAEAIRIVLQMADDKGLVEVVDPSDILSKEFNDIVYDQIEKDVKLLHNLFPDHVKIVGPLDDEQSQDGQQSHIFVNISGFEYCPFYLWSIYVSLTLARTWKANCLFDNQALNYCRYKFGINVVPKESDPGVVQSFSNVINTKLPNELLFPKYIFNANSQCKSCAEEDLCEKTYLPQLENNTANFLKWRDYDEVIQMRIELTKVIDKKLRMENIVDPNEVIKEFMVKQSRYEKMLSAVFPRISRWANIGTMVSIPVAVAGIAAQNPMIVVTGAALAGISKLTEEAIKLLTSKLRWVSFLPKKVEKSMISKNE